MELHIEIERENGLLWNGFGVWKDASDDSRKRGKGSDRGILTERERKEERDFVRGEREERKGNERGVDCEGEEEGLRQ